VNLTHQKDPIPCALPLGNSYGAATRPVVSFFPSNLAINCTNKDSHKSKVFPRKDPTKQADREGKEQ